MKIMPFNIRNFLNPPSTSTTNDCLTLMLSLLSYFPLETGCAQGEDANETKAEFRRQRRRRRRTNEFILIFDVEQQTNKTTIDSRNILKN